MTFSKLTSAIVAIPACNEDERIGTCLAALAVQRTSTGLPLPAGAFEVLVLSNNCRDRTAEIARAFADRVPFPLHVVELQLPPPQSHAGGARRAAMDLAANRIAQTSSADGVLLTTDADSRVGPTWIEANLAALAAGVDAVAGYVDAEPDEHLALGRGFFERSRLEDRYLACAAEIYGRLDPRPHDPWPNHRVHSGASFALTLKAYRGIGGLPARELGEDVALALALESSGFLIRHSLDVTVTTSCRFDSRARGGAGDTMKLRHAELDAPCDADLEPASRLLYRARTKGLLRRLDTTRRLCDGTDFPRISKLISELVGAMVRGGKEVPFARIWERIEAEIPRLERRGLLRPSGLPVEIARLERVLHVLRLPPTEETKSVLDGEQRHATHNCRQVVSAIAEP